MRALRHALVPVVTLVALGSCRATTEPGALSLRGLGFYHPITSQAISELRRVASLVAVVRSANVVLIESAASDAVLQRIHGVVEVGPPLGSADGLFLEASVLFPEAATPAQLAALEDAGTITGELPEAHWYILLVPLEKLEKLDNVVGATDVTVWVDHAVRQ